MKQIARDMLRGHLEGMVLAVLARGEAHGYEVLQRLREESENALQLKEGSLYPALYRLEKAAYVKARWEREGAKRPGPRRRLYTITSKGKRALATRQEEWRHFTRVVGRILEAQP